jgi:hypothetical protein
VLAIFGTEILRLKLIVVGRIQLVPQVTAHYSSFMNKLASILCAAFCLTLVISANAADRLQHVVSFKFKNTASPEEIKKIEAAFQDLKKHIPQMGSLEWGTNISQEKHDKGFTHCFIVTFKNEKDRDTYISHPAHKAFVKILEPILEDALVLDFWPKH